jgi:hypothetical protein
MRTDHSREVRV